MGHRSVRAAVVQLARYESLTAITTPLISGLVSLERWDYVTSSFMSLGFNELGDLRFVRREGIADLSSWPTVRSRKLERASSSEL